MPTDQESGSGEVGSRKTSAARTIQFGPKVPRAEPVHLSDEVAIQIVDSRGSVPGVRERGRSAGQRP